MHPILRIWAIVAAVAALLLVLRGAWAAALAVFLLSPAPALVVERGRSDAMRVSITWLAGVAVAAAVLLGAIVAIVAMGGLPQVHEWRALLRGRP